MRVLVTVNFNDNQLRAHLLPLLELDEVEAVTLVTDMPPSAPLPKLRVRVPPRLATRVLGRAGAKLLLCLWLAARGRYDWVMGYHFAPHGLNARIVEALTRTKSLYHMIGGTTEWAGGGWESENRFLGRQRRPSRVLGAVFRRLVVRGAAAAAMGEAGRRALIAHGVDARRTFVLPPSIDASAFTSGRNGGDRYDVVTVGRLVERKRPQDLVRAVASLPGVRAGLAGDGPLRETLERLADELHAADRVELLGFRRDAATVYASAKVFALTSESEGLPVSMLEAMASGVACVLPAVGEIPSFVQDGESALLFESGDVSALAAALERLLGDEALRQAIGSAGTALVRENASVASVSRRYRALFGTFA